MRSHEALMTMCNRCINHEQCMGTGCEPRRVLAETNAMATDMNIWKCRCENMEELFETYKKALQYICMRCETLDRLVGQECDFSYIVYTAKQWEELALQKARGII